MVTIVQSVRASDCGSECRGFESTSHPKEKDFPSGNRFLSAISYSPIQRTDRCSLRKHPSVTNPKNQMRTASKIYWTRNCPKNRFSCKIHCNVLLQGHNFRSALRPNIHSNKLAPNETSLSPSAHDAGSAIVQVRIIETCREFYRLFTARPAGNTVQVVIRKPSSPEPESLPAHILPADGKPPLPYD